MTGCDESGRGPEELVRADTASRRCDFERVPRRRLRRLTRYGDVLNSRQMLSDVIVAVFDDTITALSIHRSGGRSLVPSYTLKCDEPSNM